MKNKIILLITILEILFVINASSVSACTGFTASDDDKVLVGSNEDWRRYRRYVEIYPPEEGAYGKIFFCYDVAYCQQAMNDQGLFYDGFWAPHLDIDEGAGKPRPPGWMIDDWMNECSTVDEVIDSYESYDWRDSGIEDAMLFFVDRHGDSAIIEGDEIVYKEGSYQAVTNYYQTHPELGGYGFDRYETAINMLENMNDFSMEYFRDICDATHQEYPSATTIYSLVCDLTHNVIHYYYEYNYDDVWEINLDEEFQFGFQTIDVLDVFNNNKPDKPNIPVGPNTCDEYSTHDYSCQATDIDGDQLYYKWDFGDGTVSNWIGPFNSGETCTQSHQWIDAGKYQVKVMVRDENCGKSQWSDPLEIQVIDSDNNRPNKPLTPSGPTNGKPGEEYIYTTNTTDPDGDQLYYLWDWGDGTDSGWIGSYDSGEECSISNIWNSKGNYEIKVKAKDIDDVESEWSDPLSVSMPRNKVINRLIQNFLEQYTYLSLILKFILKHAMY
jgi:hypothetical protein